MAKRPIAASVYVGTSGWTYDDWNGVFYPPGVRGPDRLAYYAQKFDTVEVNATYYRFPSPAAINAWNSRLEDDFHLVVKGHRSITHYKKLVDCRDTLQAFMERVLQLNRLKVILWQMPPSLHKDVDRLDVFLKMLPATVRHAVEFRHPSWWNDDTKALLTRHNAAFVAVSHPKLPDTILTTADFLYLRWHGLGKELYRYDYSHEELAEWARRVRPLIEGRTLYAFFNNDYEAHAPKNAVILRNILGNIY